MVKFEPNLKRLTAADLSDLEDAIDAAVEHNITEFNFLVKRYDEDANDVVGIGVVAVRYDGADNEHYITLS